MQTQRDCQRNQGFVALPELATEVWIAAVIVVTQSEDGSFGVMIQTEDIDELPSPEVQLDLGSTIAAAWLAASIESASAD